MTIGFTARLNELVLGLKNKFVRPILLASCYDETILPCSMKEDEFKH